MPDLFQPFQPRSNLNRVGWNAANVSGARLSAICSNRSNLNARPRRRKYNNGGDVFSLYARANTLERLEQRVINNGKSMGYRVPTSAKKVGTRLERLEQD